MTRARDEYYPFYDPRWDAPGWARPPPSKEEGDEEEGDEEEGDEEEEEDADEILIEDHPRDASARDFMDASAPSDRSEDSGMHDAETSTGDGWEDLA